jgi:hypothetical protein
MPRIEANCSSERLNHYPMPPNLLSELKAEVVAVSAMGFAQKANKCITTELPPQHRYLPLRPTPRPAAYSEHGDQ